MDALLTKPATQRRATWMFLTALFILASVTVARLATTYPAADLPASGEAAAPVERSSIDYINRMQERVRQQPANSTAQAELGLALLQRVRLTGDPTLYSQAEVAFQRALEQNPTQFEALVGMGMLAASRHDFQGALAWAEEAQQINPYSATVLGIQVDSLVESGRYEEAATTLQTMVDLRPDLASFSRVSYLRELHGDTTGAIDAMRRAVAAGAPAVEETLWAQVQLGHLYFHSGQLVAAEAEYAHVMRANESYLPAVAGLARVRVAQEAYATAISMYESVVDRLPLPEYVIALGELYEATGQAEEAGIQYELVNAMQQLNASAGMDVELELALFNADHGPDPALAVQQATAAYEMRPGIYAADALAWALYRAGDFEAARRYSDESLRLGTRDASLFYRAGKIALAAGETEQARAFLQKALEINPYFSVLGAADARALLAELEG
jgi:tetratricopeptide (TPR) repeat protein